MKLIRTSKILLYADNVNSLEKNINTI